MPAGLANDGARYNLIARRRRVLGLRGSAFGEWTNGFLIYQRQTVVAVGKTNVSFFERIFYQIESGRAKFKLLALIQPDNNDPFNST